jgi:hypothetical protein
MLANLPAPDAPVDSITGAIARMEAIEAALPAADGLACFNRMYLDVTMQVNSQLGQGFFADPAFMTHLSVAFANLYFAVADSAADLATVPLAWRPLVERRAVTGIEPVQFALAGMNVHINHDLPVAMVSTCTALATSPYAAPHFADYQKTDRMLDANEQSIRRSFEPMAPSPETALHFADHQKVDQLLDATEQSIRQSFESIPELAVDHHLSAVANLTDNWTTNSARDLAWKNCLLLWAVRDDPVARGLFLDTLATSTALASRTLLVAV